jgi:hypothetical protein
MISIRPARKPAIQHSPVPKTTSSDKSVGKLILGVGSFTLACLLSPCCAPIWLPLVLALLAGTPLAVLLSAYIGWVYAGLTVLFVVGAFFGWRMLRHGPAMRTLSTAARDCVSACSTDCSCKRDE